MPLRAELLCRRTAGSCVHTPSSGARTGNFTVVARGKAAGTQRELAVRNWLRDRDWLAFRAPASLGVADVVALKAGTRPRLVEVKSTAQGPYERFGPKDRADLRFAAQLAGADAFLAWWPPRGSLRWIPESEWPEPRFECVTDESAGQADHSPP